MDKHKVRITAWFESPDFMEALIRFGLQGFVEHGVPNTGGAINYLYDGPAKEDAELISKLVKEHNRKSRSE